MERGSPLGSRVREGVEGWLFPAEEIGDWANWKGLELPGEEKEGDYLQVGGPWGRGSQEWGGDGGTGDRGRGPVCKPTELDPQRYRVREQEAGGGDGARRF